MTAINTLDQAKYYEVSLSVEGDQLRPAATNPPPQHLMERLQANKPLLIKHLDHYQNADAETACQVWYKHYWGCELCKGHHTKLRPPPVHPCNEGELLVTIYNRIPTPITR
ncbi:MAG: hypothetical protein GX029_13075 [Pseudomonadaceae bacterium]|nr:hypothetical protein [Pseudomonadaceae bacterium]